MTYRKRDRSVKERICQAMISLVNTSDKPYDEITIQEIVDEAGVCRNSFYRNYSSKNDIFIQRFQEVAVESGELLQSLSGDFMHNVFYSFFETARLNRDFLLSFYRAVPKVYFDTFTRVILQSNTTGQLKDMSAEKYYKAACKSWITVGMLTEWMNRDCDTPIETVITWFEDWCKGMIE